MSNREYAKEVLDEMYAEYQKRKQRRKNEPEPYNCLVLRYLIEHDSITPMQAIDMYDCTRLGARIFDLRERGVQIQTEKIKTKRGGEVARYTLL